jgi:hypothetical protein
MSRSMGLTHSVWRRPLPLMLYMADDGLTALVDVDVHDADLSQVSRCSRPLSTVRSTR